MLFVCCTAVAESFDEEVAEARNRAFHYTDPSASQLLHMAMSFG